MKAQKPSASRSSTVKPIAMNQARSHRLDWLAETIVRVGIGLLDGQKLLVQAPVDGNPLVRRVAARAYAAGASLVTVLLDDPEYQHLRLAEARDESFDHAAEWQTDGIVRALHENTALLRLVGHSPTSPTGCDISRVARLSRAHSAATARIMHELDALRLNWCVAAVVTPAWARAVFPHADEDTAVDLLWDAIFAASRVDSPDPLAVWQQHLAQMQVRAGLLNSRRYKALRFIGPQTNLQVGLAEGHIWRDASLNAANGARCVVNLPTEEVFTMPHRDRVDGVVSSTKPLLLAGTLIEDIVMRFEAGRCVQATARSGQRLLRQVMQTDEGASRLGEVALVSSTSPISRSGLLFQNTLLDENAASHVALGRCLKRSLEDGQKMSRAELARRGGNDSLVHIDWMIGSSDVDVDGQTYDRGYEPIMRNGVWV